MTYHYESTSEFIKSISEVDTLKKLAASDDENRTLFLKLSIVSLVTKFQVFIEKILLEFREGINGVTSDKLPLYMKMNAVKLTVLDNSNALIAIKNHKTFTEEKKNKIVDYLDSISFISNHHKKIDNSFRFDTKFPLGRTGKNELIKLLSQIDGDESPFDKFDKDDFNKLDSLLQVRHLIIHQDRFMGTETTVSDNIHFLKNLAEYIDNYIFEKYQKFS